MTTDGYVPFDVSWNLTDPDRVLHHSCTEAFKLKAYLYCILVLRSAAVYLHLPNTFLLKSLILSIRPHIRAGTRTSPVYYF
jgi:hypothetical protein